MFLIVMGSYLWKSPYSWANRGMWERNSVLSWDQDSLVVIVISPNTWWILITRSSPECDRYLSWIYEFLTSLLHSRGRDSDEDLKLLISHTSGNGPFIPGWTSHSCWTWWLFSQREEAYKQLWTWLLSIILCQMRSIEHSERLFSLYSTF